MRNWIRGKLADAVCDSYAAENQQFYDKIVKLRAALQNLADNVLDYERANNLSPNPGRKYCWDTVEQAVSVLEQTK